LFYVNSGATKIRHHNHVAIFFAPVRGVAKPFRLPGPLPLTLRVPPLVAGEGAGFDAPPSANTASCTPQIIPGGLATRPLRCRDSNAQTKIKNS
jgi:hypothetical protein